MRLDKLQIIIAGHSFFRVLSKIVACIAMSTNNPEIFGVSYQTRIALMLNHKKKRVEFFEYSS